MQFLTETQPSTYPGIYNWLLIKCHLLTFSYTASHLPLEFTVRVLPPLFLWEQQTHLMTKLFTWTAKITWCLERGKWISCVTHRSIHVSWWITVGVCQHGDNANHDCLYCVDGKPALLRLFITKLIFSWLVQNRDANISVLCDCEEREHDFNNQCSVTRVTLLLKQKKNITIWLWKATWYKRTSKRIMHVCTIWVPNFSDKLHLWRP